MNEDNFVIVMHIPFYVYIYNFIADLIVVLLIGKIIFWLYDAYDGHRRVRADLRDKYLEVSKFKVALEQVATTDFLTKLYNRRYMIERIEEEKLYNKTNKDANFIILMMDIDHFKNVNDTYGHLAGDEVLKAVAGKISNNVRNIDLVSRWGGEEMLVVLLNTSMDTGYSIAQRIRKTVEDTTTIVSDVEIKVTISIGIEEMKMSEKFDSALINADEALYEAKTGGRNQVVIYSDKSL